MTDRSLPSSPEDGQISEVFVHEHSDVQTAAIDWASYIAEYSKDEVGDESQTVDWKNIAEEHPFDVARTESDTIAEGVDAQCNADSASGWIFDEATGNYYTTDTESGHMYCVDCTGRCYYFDIDSQQFEPFETPTEDNTQQQLKPLVLRLTGVHDSSDYLEFPPTPGEVSIGRSRSADRCIEDRELSAIHASIQFKDDSFYICDLGSRNGTFVQSQRISDSRCKSCLVQVQPNDMIQFANRLYQASLISQSDVADTDDPGDQNRVLFLSKEEKARRMREELLQLKRLWNLKSKKELEGDLERKHNYRDRAKERRQRYRDSTPDDSFLGTRPQDASDAIQLTSAQPNSASGEGRAGKIMERMGWSVGQGLGAAGQGEKSTIKVYNRGSSRAGLGFGSQGEMVGATPEEINSAKRRKLYDRYYENR
eukprot:GILK01009560.1.p1 GENE.GILK01009560.1~~GILK01009560.1.p1  ORF type:complete len:424 (+),score=52.34 GILK01009560.1:144-1415(+)